MKKQPAKNVKFTNNEPVKKIPGGSQRESTIVSRAAFPMVRRREQLNALFLNHCATGNIETTLKKSDEQLVHRMALETIATGTHPMVRKRAIEAVRLFPTSASFALLTDLSGSGEDDYIRSHALRALGAMGVSIAVPTLIKSLKEPSTRIRFAAENGLRSTVAKLGGESIRPLMQEERNKRIRAILQAVVTEKHGKGRKGGSRLSPSEATKEKK